jgi:ankyrin repeat protein
LLHVFLEKKADVEALTNISNKLGESPLHWSAKNQHDIVSKMLLEHKANINAKTTPKKDAEPKSKEAKGESVLEWVIESCEKLAIHWAARNGKSLGKSQNVEVAKLLLEPPKELITEEEKRKLISDDMLPTTVNHTDDLGATPLHWAASNGDIEMMNWLIEKKGDMNLYDDEGKYPVHWAAAYGTVEATQLLLDRNNKFGASKPAQDNDGATPIYWACREDQQEICSLLLKEGAVPKAIDVFGWNALHWAVKKSNAVTAREIIKVVDDKMKNLKDKDQGWTPLHWAARGGDRESVIALMDGGVDHTSKAAKDKQGRYAVHWAAEQDMVPEGTSRPNKIFSWPTDEEKAKKNQTKGALVREPALG